MTLMTIGLIIDSPSSQLPQQNDCCPRRMPFTISKPHGHIYLESGHGKGPCDGVGGAIKKWQTTL
jgi:hypothetical protein